MRSLLTTLLLCASWVFAPPAAAAPKAAAERVVLISLDGFAAHYLDDADLRLPHLRGLARLGVHGASRTVLPSVTWAAHTTLITGTLPRRHGVIGNHWLDRSSRTVVHAWQPSKKDSILVPTIFDVAKAAGMTTAALSWPQTNGAESLDFEIPEVYSRAAFKRWVTPRLRTELLAAGMPIDKIYELSRAEDVPLDRLVADAAQHLIEVHDPKLLLVHFTSADTRAHRSGQLSDRHRAGMQVYDELVGQLLQALSAAGRRDSTAIFVVSDHGFFDIESAVDSAKVLAQAGLKKRDVQVVHNGHLAYVYVRGGKGRQSRVAVAHKALETHPAVHTVIGVARYHEFGLPTPSENPAIGDLVAITKPQFAFQELEGNAVVGPYGYKATHGYFPEHPANYPVLIAAGAGVARRRRLFQARNLDVAPTIAHLLGLDMPSADGRVIAEIVGR